MPQWDCNTLQHTATHCCNTLQHTATHCNALQRSFICVLSRCRDKNGLRLLKFELEKYAINWEVCVCVSLACAHTYTLTQTHLLSHILTIFSSSPTTRTHRFFLFLGHTPAKPSYTYAHMHICTHTLSLFHPPHTQPHANTHTLSHMHYHSLSPEHAQTHKCTQIHPHVYICIFSIQSFWEHTHTILRQQASKHTSQSSKGHIVVNIFTHIQGSSVKTHGSLVRKYESLVRI